MPDTNTDALVKLAEDLTSRVDDLEKENATLKAQLEEATSQQKTAAEAAAEPVNVVPEQVADATVDILHKVGMLTDDQLDESRKVLLSDASAPHRILQKILDAQLQTKTAALDEGNIEGGKLSSQPATAVVDAMDECFNRMARTLNML